MLQTAVDHISAFEWTRVLFENAVGSAIVLNKYPPKHRLPELAMLLAAESERSCTTCRCSKEDAMASWNSSNGTRSKPVQSNTRYEATLFLMGTKVGDRSLGIFVDLMQIVVMLWNNGVSSGFHVDKHT